MTSWGGPCCAPTRSARSWPDSTPWSTCRPPMARGSTRPRRPRPPTRPCCHGPGSSWRGERAWSSTHRSRRRGGGARRRASRPTAEAELTELHCLLPAKVAAARLAQRAAEGGDASDATASIAGAMADEFEPWTSATSVGTLPPIDDVLPAVLDRLDAPLLRRTTSASRVAVDPGLRPALATRRTAQGATANAYGRRGRGQSIGSTAWRGTGTIGCGAGHRAVTSSNVVR